MSQENKRVRLGIVQAKIGIVRAKTAGVLARLEQVDIKYAELYEVEEALTIELEKLRQKESKLLGVKPV